MSDIRVETVVARPKADVAAYMFDPANDVAWTTGITAARPLTPGRLRVGSRVVRSARFAGRKFDYEYRVTEARGDDAIELHVDKPFPMDVRYELESTAGGTRVSIRAGGKPGFFFGLVSPLLQPMVRRNITNDLKALKANLERQT